SSSMRPGSRPIWLRCGDGAQEANGYEALRAATASPRLAAVARGRDVMAATSFTRSVGLTGLAAARSRPRLGHTGAGKLCRRLGGDPMDDYYNPEKPPRIRGARFDRLLGKLIAPDRVADERMLLLASK